MSLFFQKASNQFIPTEDPYEQGENEYSQEQGDFIESETEILHDYQAQSADAQRGDQQSAPGIPTGSSNNQVLGSVVTTPRDLSLSNRPSRVFPGTITTYHQFKNRLEIRHGVLPGPTAKSGFLNATDAEMCAYVVELFDAIEDLSAIVDEIPIGAVNGTQIPLAIRFTQNCTCTPTRIQDRAWETIVECVSEQYAADNDAKHPSKAKSKKDQGYFESFENWQERAKAVIETCRKSKKSCKSMLDPDFIRRLVFAPVKQFLIKKQNEKLNGDRNVANKLGNEEINKKAQEEAKALGEEGEKAIKTIRRQVIGKRAREGRSQTATVTEKPKNNAPAGKQSTANTRKRKSAAMGQNTTDQDERWAGDRDPTPVTPPRGESYQSIQGVVQQEMRAPELTPSSANHYPRGGRATRMQIYRRGNPSQTILQSRAPKSMSQNADAHQDISNQYNGVLQQTQENPSPASSYDSIYSGYSHAPYAVNSTVLPATPQQMLFGGPLRTDGYDMNPHLNLSSLQNQNIGSIPHQSSYFSQQYLGMSGSLQSPTSSHPHTYNDNWSLQQPQNLGANPNFATSQNTVTPNSQTAYSTPPGGRRSSPQSHHCENSEDHYSSRSTEHDEHEWRTHSNDSFAAGNLNNFY